MNPSAREKFIALLRAAVCDRTLVKLTLGKPGPAAEPSLKNLFARPVTLKTGPRLSLVWRHATRDITKNFPLEEALTQLEPLIGDVFLDAHLFTPAQTAQLETAADGGDRLRIKNLPAAPPASSDNHDRVKSHSIPAEAPWLRALGVTDDRGRPRPSMAPKFRQIEKFAELLGHLLRETSLAEDQPLSVVDMGSGKGYLTFAAAAMLGPRARVLGIERRADLVEFCNQAARDAHFANLEFVAGDIAVAPLPARIDMLIALHACDTATDDALAKGVRANAAVIVAAPCCQKELRPQFTAPPVLAPALRHGIFQERQAEFVTDALRALLLEAEGYETKVFEFVSTEHTAKNLMIAAIKRRPTGEPAALERVRAFAQFYGIRSQRLAAHLGVELAK